MVASLTFVVEKTHKISKIIQGQDTAVQLTVSTFVHLQASFFVHRELLTDEENLSESLFAHQG